jgi:hypothetical protein
LLKEARWHEMVKEALKEIGEEREYDVSESEKEMILPSKRFRMFRYRIEGRGLEIIHDEALPERKPYTFVARAVVF